MTRALPLLLLTLGGCAFLNRDNTPALNWVEATLLPAPEQPTARVLLYPIVFPLGLAAVIGDAFLLHPASVVGDAIDDTGDALWRNLDWDRAYVTECAALPWRVLATPVVLSCVFLVRAAFDIQRRVDAAREQEKVAAPVPQRDVQQPALDLALQECDRLLQQGDALAALERLTQLDLENCPVAQGSRARAMLLRAAHRCRHYEWFTRASSWYLGPAANESLVQLLAEMANDADPYARWKAIWFRLAVWHQPIAPEPTLRAGLQDASPFVRYSTLAFLCEAGTYERSGVLAGTLLQARAALQTELAAIAEHDAEAMNRAAATDILHQLAR
ncbi:MAG: hypothetical protein U1E76_22410 [Planctomycetota bacterium]